MAYHDDVLINATEFIKDRFFFISIKTTEKPKSTTCTHYFSVDHEFIYDSFFNDFGPLNISMLYHYCVKVSKKLRMPSLLKKKLVHYTTFNEQKRANAAFLACSYVIIYYNYTPERACEALSAHNSAEFMDFRDASVGIPYTISLLDCLSAVYKAFHSGFFNFDNFDFLEYEHYERVENGDLNWILPGKFIGFCGPHDKSMIDNGYPLHSPETYFSYFRRNKVTTIVRLNKKMYDASKFTKGGFVHKDLYFIDGSTPSDKIVNQFLTLCEKTDGAVAVHCKAGLGRTGTLIGCYIMKHYKFTAHEAIAWLRICRPGSVIGHQQNFLESKQNEMWRAGDEYRAKMGFELKKHSKGIYNYNRGPEFITFRRRLSRKNDVTGILQKVDTIQLEDKDVSKEEDKDEITQGDQLNQIKAQRRSREPRQIVNTGDKKIFRARILVSPIGNTTMLRASKVFELGVKTSAVSTSRYLAKSVSQSTTNYILPTLQTANRFCFKPGNGTNERKVYLRSSNPHTPNSSLTLTNSEAKTPRVLRSTANNGSTVKLNTSSSPAANGELIEPKIKRHAKRSLTTEKEGCSRRSVKLLRRCKVQSSSDIVHKSKFHLPKVTKNSKTP